MSAISETYNRAHNILEVVDILPNVFFFFILVKRNVIITNKNGKYELTDELPNDLILNKISKLHGIISQYSYQKENIVNTGRKLLKTRY